MKLTDCISLNAHSSIRFGGDVVLYVDPFHLTEAPHDADVILFTHDHYDHFSPENFAQVAKADTVYVAPGSMREALTAAGIGAAQAVVLEAGEKVEVAGVTIEGVPAYNLNKDFHPNGNGWLGYVLTIEGVRYYVCGDMDDTPEGRAVACDVLLVPIGGTYTMTATEAAAFANAVKPKAVVPTHYGDIVGSPEDADAFEAAVDDGIEVVRKLFV